MRPGPAFIVMSLLASSAAAEPDVKTDDDDAVEFFDIDGGVELAPGAWPDGDVGDGWVTVSKEEIDQTLGRTFSAARYPFCNDGEYRVPRRDRYLCDLADEAKNRCPEFQKTCQRLGAAATGSEERRRPPDAQKPDEELRISSSLSSLARVIFWTLLALGLLALIVAIARNFRSRERPGADAGDEPSTDDDGVARTPAPPRETDVDRLLARAREAAGRGAYDVAIRDAYWAALRQLDRSGAIQIDPSLTNGDYVRGLEEHPATQDDLRAVVRAVERVQFGSAPPSKGMFDDVLGRVVPLLHRTSLLLVLVVALVSSTGCGAFDDLGESKDASGFSHAPGGYAALAEVMQAHGARLRHRIRDFDIIHPETRMLIIVDSEPSESDWESILEWTRLGHTLVIATDPGPARTELGAERAMQPCRGELLLDEAYRSSAWFGPSTLSTVPDPTLAIDTSSWWPLVTCGGHPYVAERSLGEGRVVMFASSVLLSNAALTVADNAYVVYGFLKPPPDFGSDDATPVELVDEVTGSGARTPLDSVANGRLLPLLVQIVLVMLVFGLWRGVRFGRPRDPPTRSRRRFEEHVRALGAIYEKAGASKLALAAYGAWAVEWLRARANPGAEASLSSLSEAIARRTGRDEHEVTRILVGAMTARDEEGSGESPEDLRAFREIQSLLAELGGTQ